MGDLYYLPNARSQDQHDEMVRLEEGGLCLFCPEGLQGSDKIIYGSNSSWTLTSNDYPYVGTLHHLLLIPTRHVIALEELIADELGTMKDLIWLAKNKFDFDSYGLAVRNGNPAFTGGTIRHLHFHIVVGNPNAEEPVKVKLSSRPK